MGLFVRGIVMGRGSLGLGSDYWDRCRVMFGGSTISAGAWLWLWLWLLGYWVVAGDHLLWFSLLGTSYLGIDDLLKQAHRWVKW